MVLDYTRGPIYDRVQSDGITAQHILHFDEHNALHYLAERDGLLYYVEDQAGSLRE